MKKKILFVMESLEIGGAEKSLVTLLSKLDFKSYDVDLLLLNKTGEFLNFVPQDVNLFEVSSITKILLSPRISSIYELLKGGHVFMMILKICYFIKLLLYHYVLRKEYIGWKTVSRAIPRVENQYDYAIGFMEKKSIYFVVDKVLAITKFGWIHCDYTKIEYNKEFDKRYLHRLDKVITVSEHCKSVLINLFNLGNKKVNIIYNTIDEVLIKKMAQEKIDFIKEPGEVLLVTVARLVYAKGINTAIEACKKLIEEGYKIKWLVVGDGPEKEKLQKQIEHYNLRDYFILIGSKANPYPYINKADIYVQTSQSEGFGITVLEAKILFKPIITSNIPEFKEQIISGHNGIIYNSINDLVESVKKLVDNVEISKKLISNLNYYHYQSDRDILKFYDMFNNMS